jgi:solute carrier family 25 (mitochondrial citrate transporter), member 1
VYGELKRLLQTMQSVDTLPSWQHLLAGGISGALAPLANAPIDTLKTRIQRQINVPGSKPASILVLARDILQTEGFLAFYNGLTPRLLRIAPGQAITFMAYEKICALIHK